MERKIYEDLLKWKKEPARKPLLLYGNRQIGKTYTAIEFGEKEYKTVAEYKFEATIIGSCYGEYMYGNVFIPSTTFKNILKEREKKRNVKRII